jgi:streptogramin lyase
MKSIKKILSLLSILLVSLVLFGAVSAVSAASSVITHTYAVGINPEDIAIDTSGNVWVVNNGNGTAGTAVGDSNVMELRPNGRGGYTSATTYTAGIYPDAIAIDASGNVWVVNRGNNGTVGTAIGDSNVTELVRAAKGPQFWPYSGPQFPGGGNY